ncbi:hypothetical protein K0M31_007764 [Melipona bicolor]|uniref:Uncharacterized protein n=1 Tax=Melipona bicolor TaxID=60889 RepID=A0AA40KWC1_9HYME|nr:hypothetical protein K0M31_007764 [Melipona bicolor]
MPIFFQNENDPKSLERPRDQFLEDMKIDSKTETVDGQFTIARNVCPPVVWEVRFVREPASSLAKSSSRSSLAPLPTTLTPSLPIDGVSPSDISDKPGPFSWTQRATRLVNERQTSTDDTSRDGHKSHSAH